VSQDVSGPVDDSGPQTNAGKDFMAGYLRAIDIYFGDVVVGERINDEELSSAKFEACRYEQQIIHDPDRQEQ
jgi:hypothetical protein